MAWRPENWYNPYQIPVDPEGFQRFLDEHKGFDKQKATLIKQSLFSFEAGADAMLEALKARHKYFLLGVQAGADPSHLHLAFRNDPGWLVFIPEDEPVVADGQKP